MKTFGEFQEAAAAIKTLPYAVKAFTKIAPMVAPKLKTFAKFSTAVPVGLTAAGTIMQARKKRERIPISKRNYKSDEKTVEVAKELGLDLTDPRQRRKAQSRAVARGLKKKNKTNKKINTKTGDVVKSRYTTKDKTIKFEPKEGEVKKSQEMLDKLNNPNYFDKIMRNIRKEEAAPTNSMGGGAIAGSVEAGDDPPKKKCKTYAYGGRGSRKMWMSNK